MSGYVIHHIHEGRFMYLTKEAILAIDDRLYEDVQIPEWKEGDKSAMVRVRSLSGMELDKFQASILTGKGKNRDVNLKALRSKLVALTVVDGLGNPIFSDADIQALGNKNAGALNRIFQKAQELSGLNEEEVNDMVKNSETDQNGDSTSV